MTFPDRPWWKLQYDDGMVRYVRLSNLQVWGFSFNKVDWDERIIYCSAKNYEKKLERRHIRETSRGFRLTNRPEPPRMTTLTQ